MTNSPRNKLFVFILIFLVLLIGVLMYLLISLDSEKSKTNLEYKSFKQECQGNLQGCQSGAQVLEKEKQDLINALMSLNQSYISLNKSHSELGSEYFRLGEEYSSLKEEVNATMLKIEEYKNSINQSMSWFSMNSFLGDEKKEAKTKEELTKSCIIISGDSCTLNTGCFWLVNKEMLGLNYKIDKYTTNSEDRLQSIADFIKNWGGDCEDYALFYKAEWNYMVDECGDAKKIFQDTYEYDPTTGGIHWLDNKEKWYVKNSRDLKLEGYIHPSVVCGNIYDPQSGNINGHCVIALTKKPIGSLSELYRLEEASLIEPQNGGYLGRINGDSSKIFLLSDGDNLTRYESFIYMVITDSDLFMYSQGYKMWEGYSSFYEDLDEQKNRLVDMI